MTSFCASPGIGTPASILNSELIVTRQFRFWHLADIAMVLNLPPNFPQIWEEVYARILNGLEPRKFMPPTSLFEIAMYLPSLASSFFGSAHYLWRQTRDL
jgi:hypothetical protein